MPGLILDLKENIEAVIVIVGAAAVVWQKFARPLKRAVDRIEELVGSNDGSTVFDKLEMIASLVDVIDQPSLFLSSSGEVRHVNLAFTDETGIPISSLAYGGWRQLFDSEAQDEWDRAVERHSVFARSLTIRARTWNVLSKPVFNGQKFLGWRVRLTERKIVES